MVGSPNSSYRLIIASLCVATKYLYDDAYHNNSWYSISHEIFSLAEINRMELEFMYFLRYDLYISGNEWNLWIAALEAKLVNYWHSKYHGSPEVSNGIGTDQIQNTFSNSGPKKTRFSFIKKDINLEELGIKFFYRNQIFLAFECCDLADAPTISNLAWSPKGQTLLESLNRSIYKTSLKKSKQGELSNSKISGSGGFIASTPGYKSSDSSVVSSLGSSRIKSSLGSEKTMNASTSASSVGLVTPSKTGFDGDGVTSKERYPSLDKSESFHHLDYSTLQTTPYSKYFGLKREKRYAENEKYIKKHDNTLFYIPENSAINQDARKENKYQGYGTKNTNSEASSGSSNIVISNPFPIPLIYSKQSGIRNDSNTSNKTMIDDWNEPSLGEHNNPDISRKIDELSKIYSRMELAESETPDKIAKICTRSDINPNKNNFDLISFQIPSYKIDLKRGGQNLCNKIGSPIPPRSSSRIGNRRDSSNIAANNSSRPIYDDFSRIPFLSKRVSVRKPTEQDCKLLGLELLKTDVDYQAHRNKVISDAKLTKVGDNNSTSNFVNARIRSKSKSTDSELSALSSPIYSLESNFSNSSLESNYVQISEKVLLTKLGNDDVYQKPSVINISDFKRI
ncbi:hypothetical protein AYI68_g824 [Smittium mucronatum]|uniref:G1/S-specific cyclin pas1 n=1 Tax=Smittium mucronatum TaxID=133383 RepID=A0A1R0H7A2_9FUNG|nr:hypothetical protein AYI68_g816 [Smittium mucronatum]OLY85006.1 hypothetical protein AYI68_g824 [Smittium mucronatum]